VLNPAETKDLYFVADGAGGHIFSETLKDYNTNVQKWRAVEKEMKAKLLPAPAPGDTPTTAQPKTRAVVRTPPDKSKVPVPPSPPASGTEPAAGKDAKGWSSTTQPAQSQPKR